MSSMLSTEGPLAMAGKQQQSGQNNHNNVTVTVQNDPRDFHGVHGIMEKSNYQDAANDFNIITPCVCSPKSDYNCSCGDVRTVKQRANTTVSVMTDICKINMDDSLETEHIFAEDEGYDGKRHRFMSSERLDSFSDAVFATVTTFMIVPVVHAVANYDVNEHLTNTLLGDWFRFVTFAIAFLVVHSIWQQHVWIFETIKNVGDTVIILNVSEAVSILEAIQDGSIDVYEPNSKIEGVIGSLYEWQIENKGPQQNLLSPQSARALWDVFGKDIRRGYVPMTRYHQRVQGNAYFKSHHKWKRRKCTGTLFSKAKHLSRRYKVARKEDTTDDTDTDSDAE